MLPLISVVVPCHNEADSLDRLHSETVAAITGLADDYELILVDDGSRDATLSLATDIAARDHHVRVISFTRNFGKEAAMLAGLRASRGEAVAIMDADLQHPPQMLQEMVAILESGEWDQVVARRSREGESKVRAFLSRTFYRFVNGMVDVELADGVGDFRVLTRRAIDSLLKLDESSRFSKGLFNWIGYKTKAIDYSNVTRDSGQSSWTLRSLLNYAIDGVVSFNQRPLRSIFVMGFGSVVIGLLYLLWLVIGWFVHGVETPGYLTSIAAITLFGGVQLISLAIIAEYVGKIYLEVKDRPHYLIATELNKPADVDTAADVEDPVIRGMER